MLFKPVVSGLILAKSINYNSAHSILGNAAKPFLNLYISHTHFFPHIILLYTFFFVPFSFFFILLLPPTLLLFLYHHQHLFSSFFTPMTTILYYDFYNPLPLSSSASIPPFLYITILCYFSSYSYLYKSL